MRKGRRQNKTELPVKRVVSPARSPTATVTSPATLTSHAIVASPAIVTSPARVASPETVTYPARVASPAKVTSPATVTSTRVTSPAREASTRVTSPAAIASPLASRIYSCGDCNYRVNSFLHLRDHRLLHQHSQGVTCTPCGIVFKSDKAIKIWHSKNGVHHTSERSVEARNSVNNGQRSGVEARNGVNNGGRGGVEARNSVDNRHSSVKAKKRDDHGGRISIKERKSVDNRYRSGVKARNSVDDRSRSSVDLRGRSRVKARRSVDHQEERSSSEAHGSKKRHITGRSSGHKRGKKTCSSTSLAEKAISKLRTIMDGPVGKDCEKTVEGFESCRKVAEKVVPEFHGMVAGSSGMVQDAQSAVFDKVYTNNNSLDANGNTSVENVNTRNNNVLDSPGQSDYCRDVWKTSKNNMNKVDENANIPIATNSQTPVNSLSCCSCEYVASSYESFSSHYVANHFLGSGSTDVNNNEEPTMSKSADTSKVADTAKVAVGADSDWGEFKLDKDISGGFAKKYKAKKQKGVYAVVSKQDQQKHLASTENRTQGFQSGKTPATVDENNNTVCKKKMAILGLRTKGKPTPETSDVNNNAGSTGGEVSTAGVAGGGVLARGVVKDSIKAELLTNELGRGVTRRGAGGRVKSGGRVKAGGVTGIGSMGGVAARDGARESMGAELLTCLVCASCFPVKADLLKHLTRIHRLTNLCQICYFREGQITRFANPVSLRNHKMRLHPDDMVKCVCGAMLIDEKMLLSHLKKFKCDGRDQEPNGTPQMVKCVCGKRFGSPDLLAAHKMKCRKRSHSEESDRSSLSSVSTDQNVGNDGHTVKSPAYNTRSLYSKKTVDAGSSLDMSLSQEQKRQLRDRKPVRCSLVGEEKVSGSQQVEEKVFPGSQESAKPVLKRGQLSGQEAAKETILKQALKISAHPESVQQTGAETVTKGTVMQAEASGSKNRKKGPKCAVEKKRGPRKKRPDAEGKYPCKVCRRRFKRPYLYVHQKNAHQRKQWVLVPSARPRKAGDHGMTYRCGWCKFVFVHWRSVIYHHYSKHQDMELDVITMVNKPSVNQE